MAYTVITALIVVPVLAWYPDIVDVTFTVFRMTSGLVGLPWP